MTMPRSTFPLVVLSSFLLTVSVSLTPLLGAAPAPNALSPIDFDAPIDRSFTRQKDRDDGARVYRAKSGTLLVLRLFFDEGKPAAKWMAEEARVQGERGAVGLKVAGGRKVGARKWYDLEYRSRLPRNGLRLDIACSVTEVGPFLFVASLGGPPSDVAGRRWVLDRMRAKIRFGSMGELGRGDWRLADEGDLVGTWNVAAFATNGEPSPTNPLHYPYQRFEFDANKSMRHICHTAPITPDVLGQLAGGPRRLHFAMPQRGLLKVSTAGTTRFDSHIALRVRRRAGATATPNARRGAATDAIRDQDIVLIYRTLPQHPVVVRVLRRDGGVTTAAPSLTSARQ